MDREVITIGHGRGSRFRDSHPLNQRDGPANQRRRARPEMVLIYNGDDNFVGQISARSLIRFSRVAGDELPRRQEAPTMPQQDAPVAVNLSQQAGPSSAGNQTASLAIPTMPLGRGRGNAAAVPLAAAPSTSLPAASTVPPANASPNTRQRMNPLTLILSLDSYQTPTNGAVLYTLSWMRENSRRNGSRQLTAFAGSNLNELSDVDALDYYQAALAFSLRPFPRALRENLLWRMSSSPPSLETMQIFNECLPLRDQVLHAMMTSYVRNYQGHGYTQAEVDAFHDYIFAEGNEEFADRILNIGRLRRRAERREGLASRTRSGRGAGPSSSSAAEPRGGRRDGRGRGRGRGQGRGRGGSRGR